MSILQEKENYIRKTYDYTKEQVKLIEKISEEHNIKKSVLIRYAMKEGLKVVQEELKSK